MSYYDLVQFTPTLKDITVMSSNWFAQRGLKSGQGNIRVSFPHHNNGMKSCLLADMPNTNDLILINPVNDMIYTKADPFIYFYQLAKWRGYWVFEDYGNDTNI